MNVRHRSHHRSRQPVKGNEAGGTVPEVQQVHRQGA